MKILTLLYVVVEVWQVYNTRVLQTRASTWWRELPRRSNWTLWCRETRMVNCSPVDHASPEHCSDAHDSLTMNHLLLMTGLGLERGNINGVVIMDWYKVMVSGRDVIVTCIIGVSCVISDALNSLQMWMLRAEVKQTFQKVFWMYFMKIFSSLTW